VEYYFSRENLVQDAFLVSKMDKEHYVDLSVIAEFKLMKALTTDDSVILEAVKSSTKISVDDSAKRLRPTVSNARTTLILRNIPSATPEEELKKFLNDAKLPNLVSMRSDVGDNWFVRLESEDAAKQALELVKQLKWEGKTIGCAIKSESLLKGITPGSPPKVGNSGFYMPMQYGYGYYQSGEGGQGGFRQGGRGGSRRPINGNANGMGVDGSDASGKRQGKKGKGRSGREGGGQGREGGSPVGGVDKDAMVAQQPPLNMADFPELESKSGVERVSPREGGWGDKKLDLRSVVAAGPAKAAPMLESVDDKKGPSAPSGNGSAEPKEVNGPIASDNSSAASSSDGGSSSAISPIGEPAGIKNEPKKMSFAQMVQMNGTAQPQNDIKVAAT